MHRLYENDDIAVFWNSDKCFKSNDPDRCGSFATYKGQEIGECLYQATDSGWNIYHTGVIPEHGGKGIAKRLVYKLLEEADRQKINIQATCSYARKVMDE